MGKIFYIMGKSASGKDSLYKKLKEDKDLCLKEVVLYTTRPVRSGEENGKDYFFVDEDEVNKWIRLNKVIELRSYNTVHGVWKYFTADDGQINLSENSNYIMVGTLESYEKTKQYYGDKALIPLYIWVEDGVRLGRALYRERMQQNPKYSELCRRFLADEEDFSTNKLSRCGIKDFYENEDLNNCYRLLKDKILSYTKNR